MLKKLRIKFILINMLIVVVMLAFIFTTLFLTTGRNLERESRQSMERIASAPLNVPFPGQEDQSFNFSYFRVMINNDGTKEIVGDLFGGLSEEQALELAKQAASSSSSGGIEVSLGIRFFKAQTPMGTCIVFADNSAEKLFLSVLLRTFLLIGGLACLVFLGISILFSRWAVKPVEKAWNQQKQFIADASHELKTPLTVIRTDAELLQSPDCTETERLKLSDSILVMSEQMRGLVLSMLDLARLESSVKKKKETVNLSESVSLASMMFEPVFFESDLLYTDEIEPDITVMGDKVKLKQLTDILLDNALKYARAGAVVKLTLKRLSGKVCMLSVSNEGNPISDEDLKNLFKRFYRVDQARTMNHSYGLGLSIAQAIVTEHGGKIRAESKDGLNTFTVEIPLKKNTEKKKRGL